LRTIAIVSRGGKKRKLRLLFDCEGEKKEEKKECVTSFHVAGKHASNCLENWLKKKGGEKRTSASVERKKKKGKGEK